MLLPSGEYKSQDEQEAYTTDPEENTEYPEIGEMLITRLLSILVNSEETTQRENIFHTRCIVNNKVCNLIIYGGSCINVASKYMVEKLGIPTTKNSRPYMLRWLNDQAELKNTKEATIPFSIGKYHDIVICDVVPM